VSNDLRFDDQVAVTSGTGGGLGKQYALLLASRGTRVVVNDIGGSVTGSGSNTDAATAAVEEIRDEAGYTVPTGPADEMAALFATIMADQAG
jgi:NAD(P)-dependent dehydrogenase (short-subunit alcohol dehydrogenase family)